MSRADTYDIVREACNYCWSKNFLNVLRDFFAQHAYLFKDCMNDSPPSIEEQDLDQYAVYQRYLRLYEETLSDYINSLDVSVEDFFFQLEGKNDSVCAEVRGWCVCGRERERERERERKE